VTVSRILDVVETLWPVSGAESWDTPGLQLGSRRHPVSRVLLSVDVTPEVIREARAIGAELVICHHPLFLRGLHSVTEDSDRGALVGLALDAGLSVIAAHTNADVVTEGVSDVLARALDLQSVVPLIEGESSESGLGRYGTLSKPASLKELAVRLAEILPATVSGIRVSGAPEAVISSVALCGGAGDSLLSIALVANSDVYITSDLRHHPALDAGIRAELGLGPHVIDISHWASESLWLAVAARELTAAVPGCEFVLSEVRTDPWAFTVA
jgi:dinuclear metal center YbgI/SA1388 family protein